MSSWPCRPTTTCSYRFSKETVLNGITVVGSIVGTRKDLAEVFAPHAMGRTTVIRETRGLDQVNECFEEVEKGQVKARIVFDLR